LAFEDDVVGDLLFEMRESALPLLQFTLDQLFQQRHGHLLTRQAYSDIGGVKGALIKQAKRTFETLPSDEHRILARGMFIRLIDLGVSEQDTTRRRARLSEFSLPDSKQNQLLRETMEAFIEARLLTTKKLGETSTLEVSPVW
jgi:hypothetical protein